ncbi:hypothetical protein EGT49_05175 [Companilactobacillus suantsaicola]|uniref:Uncharacterized protein n=1 Tax=Companilactobacillus suantsaicola TaxID=2487723 RepID=A0A4Z0JL38_9LACO|nr:hypothetical protein [Companilactobacillus suantsaicola]TGD23652.1 hypothetical protein EGT49_05175 [Companilactobacillus suantsaicola]
MKRPVRRIIQTLMLIIALFLTSVSTSKTALALTTYDNSAIADHPGGLNIQDYFVKDSFSYVKDFPFTKNSAKVGGNGDVLILTDGEGDDVKGTLGALWGDQNNLNYININERQTISAWLYFGPDKSDELYNGHGMTLVLQNDNRKTQAIGMGLQGLGVYGYDKHKTSFFAGLATDRNPPTTDWILNTAIKNSMALEFDTQRSDVNGTPSDPANFTNGRTGYPITMSESLVLGTGSGTYSLNGYDTVNTASASAPAVFPDDTYLGASGTYGHIALTYPGIIDSYYKYPIRDGDNASQWKGYEEAPSIFHINSAKAQLINDYDENGDSILWHHITFEWIPHDYDDKATIKYSYNDKKVSGEENLNTTDRDFKRIDKEIIVNPDIFNAGADGKVLWGFTGANGHTNEVNSKLVVFESIPAMVTGQAEATIKNLDTGKTVTEQDKYVPHGSNLELNYRVEFVRGRENWQDIVGKIDLPEHVTYTKDGETTAVIEYENGSIETVNSAFDYFPNPLSAPIQEPLGNLNGNPNSYANVKIYGTAINETDTNITVDEQPAVFTGSNAIASTNTPEFIIGNKKSWNLNLAGGGEINLPFEQESELSLPTTLSYTQGHPIQADDQFTYQIAITGQDKTYSLTSSVDQDGKLNLPLKEIIGDEFWKIFQEGTKQVVTITARDGDLIKSNPITFTINVIANRLLNLEVSDNLEFETITSYSEDDILNRVSDYDVIVNSLRNPWTLSVAASDLVNSNGGVFDGDLTYIDENREQTIGDEVVDIFSDINSYEENKAVNISDGWNENSGILLRQYERNQGGQYRGLLTWQVGDYMKNL